MRNINKYPSITEYENDTRRPADENTVSLIANTQEIILNPANIIVGLESSGVGDIVVWDSNKEVPKVVKLESLQLSKLHEQYIIVGVVGYRNTHEVLAYGTTQTSLQWAANHEIKLSNFTKGESFTITINSSTTNAITYEVSDTLTTLATKIQAEIVQLYSAGWSTTAYSDYILVQLNYHEQVVSTFATSSSNITIYEPTDNYQTKLTSFNEVYANVSRVDGLVTYYGGLNKKRFYEYYRTSGATDTNQAIRATTPVRESVFNEVDNPIIVAYYKTYENYIANKMIRYPYSKNAILLKDGKGDTERLSSVTFINHLGQETPGYPAAAYCNAYSVPGTPYGPGSWYLESVQECLKLRQNITWGTSGINASNCDALNKGLAAIGATAVSATANYWTSSEWNSLYSCVLTSYGFFTASSKRNSFSVRPLIAFHLG